MCSEGMAHPLCNRFSIGLVECPVCGGEWRCDEHFVGWTPDGRIVTGFDGLMTAELDPKVHVVLKTWRGPAKVYRA